MHKKHKEIYKITPQDKILGSVMTFNSGMKTKNMAGHIDIKAIFIILLLIISQEQIFTMTTLYKKVITAKIVNHGI